MSVPAVSLSELLFPEVDDTTIKTATPNHDLEQELEADGFVDPIELIDVIKQDGAKIEATIEGGLEPEKGTDAENDVEVVKEVDNRTSVVDNTTTTMHEVDLSMSKSSARNLVLTVVANSKGSFRLARNERGAYRLLS